MTDEELPIKQFPLFRYPVKKVEIIYEDPLHPQKFVIATIEPTAIVQQQKFSSNPNREVIFMVQNRMRERFRVVFYPKNNYLNLFVDAGVHTARFILTKKNIEELLVQLAEWLRRERGETLSSSSPPTVDINK
jgi:hypothetical protein